jgi:type IV secretory pathway TrbD component
MVQSKSHETFDRPDDVVMGSERSFGIVFGCFFLVLAGLKFWVHANIWVYVWLAAAGLTFVIAFAAPQVLRPFNAAWFRFGLLLHKVVSPLIMGLLFFGVVTPIGLIMRARGKRPLNLAFDPAATSYWIARKPPGPEPGTFQNQF